MAKPHVCLIFFRLPSSCSKSYLIRTEPRATPGKSFPGFWTPTMFFFFFIFCSPLNPCLFSVLLHLGAAFFSLPLFPRPLPALSLLFGSILHIFAGFFPPWLPEEKTLFPFLFLSRILLLFHRPPFPSVCFLPQFGDTCFLGGGHTVFLRFFTFFFRIKCSFLPLFFPFTVKCALHVQRFVPGQFPSLKVPVLTLYLFFFFFLSLFVPPLAFFFFPSFSWPYVTVILFSLPFSHFRVLLLQLPPCTLDAFYSFFILPWTDPTFPLFSCAPPLSFFPTSFFTLPELFPSRPSFPSCVFLLLYNPFFSPSRCGTSLALRSFLTAHNRILFPPFPFQFPPVYTVTVPFFFFPPSPLQHPPVSLNPVNSLEDPHGQPLCFLRKFHPILPLLCTP